MRRLHREGGGGADRRGGARDRGESAILRPTLAHRTLAAAAGGGRTPSSRAPVAATGSGVPKVHGKPVEGSRALVLARATARSPRPRSALFRLKGHRQRIFSLHAHPFLPLLASGSDDRSIRLWDLDSRSPLRVLEGHRNHIFGLAFDPAGRRLASAAGDNDVRLWDLDSGTCLHTLEGPTSAVFSVAWDFSGSLVASGSSDRCIHVWDAASGALRRRLEGHVKAVVALAAHPADDLLASGSRDRAVRIWRWSSGECIRALDAHKEAVNSLVASTACFVSASLDKSVRAWSWASGACLRVLDGYTRPLSLNSLSWLESMLVTVDMEGEVCVWKTLGSNPMWWTKLGSVPSRASSEIGVAAAGRGRLACTATDDWVDIAVWQVQ